MLGRDIISINGVVMVAELRLLIDAACFRGHGLGGLFGVFGVLDGVVWVRTGDGLGGTCGLISRMSSVAAAISTLRAGRGRSEDIPLLIFRGRGRSSSSMMRGGVTTASCVLDCLVGLKMGEREREKLKVGGLALGLLMQSADLLRAGIGTGARGFTKSSGENDWRAFNGALLDLSWTMASRWDVILCAFESIDAFLSGGWPGMVAISGSA